MELNTARIKHYTVPTISVYDLKKMVALNEGYLNEKPTWYMVDDKLQYFKIRNDFRLFTEQFFSMFGREILGIDTLDYHVTYIRATNPGEKVSKSETKCGLLSENFQNSKYNYYLVSELLNSEISNFINYGGYTLESLLAFFKDLLDQKSYTENELFLIKLFIADAFTNQEDRNCNNIGFEIPKIEGISYLRRLYPNILFSSDVPSDNYVVDSQGVVRLTGLRPSKVYDNERILGMDHKDVFNYSEGQIWCPLFPFSSETMFKTQKEASYVASLYDGLDPNLLELYLKYPDICKPIFERLVYDDEYKKILERFNDSTSQIKLSDEENQRVSFVLEDKRRIFKRILEI